MKNKIKCSVDACKHNNCEEGTCTLEKVSIGCICDDDESACDCSDTICESFSEDKSNDKNITDNVYEVDDEEKDFEDKTYEEKEIEQDVVDESE